MPLGVYRAADLQPVKGVLTGFTLQTAQYDDDRQSQIGRIWLPHAIDLDPASQRQLEAILAYDGDRDAACQSAINQATSRFF